MMLDRDFTPIGRVFARAQLDPEASILYCSLRRGFKGVKTLNFRVPEGDVDFAERIIKTMLYAYGGYELSLRGDHRLIAALAQRFAPGGERAFDAQFMQDVYGRPFVVRDMLRVPREEEDTLYADLSAGGARIGFDAGGSDRKVTALLQGKVVFQDETIWFPKLNSDPQYHVSGVLDSIDRAVEALGRAPDSIGVSSAGILIDNEVRVASLFRMVPPDLFERDIKPIYKALADRYHCPVKAVNDGDVAALSCAMAHPGTRVLGLAFGTSLAAGYVDEDAGIKGYLNELAFVPIDLQPKGALDDWSMDRGTGGQYLSQDGVIRLAREAGIPLSGDSPAERLKEVQAAAEAGDTRALAVYERFGDYMGETLLWFTEVLYAGTGCVRLMGRAVSGKGGDIAIARAKRILKKASSPVQLELPDENERRLGQSYTAALL